MADGDGYQWIHYSTDGLSKRLCEGQETLLQGSGPKTVSTDTASQVTCPDCQNILAISKAMGD